MAVQDLGDLPQDPPEIAPVDRNLVESQQRTGRGVRRRSREWHPALDAPFDGEQLQLEVDGGREVGLSVLQGPQFSDVGWLAARGAG